MSALSFRRLFALLICASGAALLALALTQAPGLRRATEPIEAATLDWRMRGSPVRTDPANAPIVLVLFDSASVAQWPWRLPVPRAALASLVDIVAAAGASVIGLDAFLDRRYPRLDEIDRGDARLREAIRAAGNVILAAKTAATRDGRVLLPPDPFFAEVAAGFATVELPATTAPAREVTLAVRTTQGLTPALPLALYARQHGLDAAALLGAADSAGSLVLPTSRVALPVRRGDAAVTLPLRHLGPAGRPNRVDGAFPAYAASAVLELGARAPAEWFRGRIVLLGAGVNQEAMYRSPFSGPAPGAEDWMYGSEVVATAAENLLRSRFIIRAGPTTTLALLFGLSLLVATASFYGGRVAGASVALFLGAATLAAAWAGFDAADLHIPITGPLIALAVSFFGSTAYVSLAEGVARRRIRQGLGQHVAPDVVADLARQPDRLRAHGDRRALTVLSAELAGLDVLANSLPPERLVGLVNACMDGFNERILEEGGLVDTSMGGAVKAIFGAPAENAHHAAAACRAALHMRRRLRDRAGDWVEPGSSRLELRVGIDTGDAIAGNIGGSRRFTYTAMGEPVSLAALLETTCVHYDVGVLVSENTVTAAGKAIRVREIDRVGLLGRAAPMRIYQLIGLADEPPDWPGQFLNFWQRGLDAYRQRDFSLAADFFMAAAEIDPADGPCTLYLERCRAFVAAPPPQDWDYVQRWEPR